MKISIKAFITHKESETFYDCADRYEYNDKLNRFAISDGVSKSFFPKIWAEVLVKNWVSMKWESHDDFIKESQKQWLNKVKEFVIKPDVKYFTKNAFNRKAPGLATFVGLRFEKEETNWFWYANALGDSFLFFIPENFDNFSSETISLSSKSDEEELVFDNFPDYITSIGKKHKGYPGKELKSQELKEGTKYNMPLISSRGNIYRVTEKAIQLNCVNNGMIWIPKSQIVDIDELTKEITLSSWIESKINASPKNNSGAY